ncbi:hypothetical protein GDO81_002819 [Engystomops pustulosus]|uniref:Uncharacterized protein n=1 Tax=Engystomops pustulosus TaxID=76066 RepID=A0AAV7DP41_ENGPU|nr:hypothetical protein GDO81_002819 [Engystomops pustulosus]
MSGALHYLAVEAAAAFFIDMVQRTSAPWTSEQLGLPSQMIVIEVMVIFGDVSAKLMGYIRTGRRYGSQR